MRSASALRIISGIGFLYLCSRNACGRFWNTLSPEGRKDERQLLTVTTPPVKMRLERPAGRDKREI